MKPQCLQQVNEVELEVGIVQMAKGLEAKCPSRSVPTFVIHLCSFLAFSGVYLVKATVEKSPNLQFKFPWCIASKPQMVSVDWRGKRF